MEITPECWTKQRLTEQQLNNICKWLMAWQKACVSGNAIATDFIQDGERLPSQQLDPHFKTAMNHVESLIRHIGALHECREG